MVETPKHYVRVDDQLWRKAQIKASAEGTTLSSLMRDWLAAYAEDESFDEELKRINRQLDGLYRRLKG